MEVTHYLVIPWKSTWKVLKKGSRRASKICSTEEEALEVAHNYCAKKGGYITVHDKDGIVTQKMPVSKGSMTVDQYLLQFEEDPDVQKYLEVARDWAKELLLDKGSSVEHDSENFKQES